MFWLGYKFRRRVFVTLKFKSTPYLRRVTCYQVILLYSMNTKENNNKNSMNCCKGNIRSTQSSKSSQLHKPNIGESNCFDFIPCACACKPNIYKIESLEAKLVMVCLTDSLNIACFPFYQPNSIACSKSAQSR